MDQQDLKKIDIAYESFCLCLKGILGTEVTLDNFKDKINRYIESKNLDGLEKKIFELFLYLNPKKENFKSESNRTLIMNIFKYLSKNIVLESNIEKKNDEKVEEERKNKDGVKIYEDSKEDDYSEITERGSTLPPLEGTLPYIKQPVRIIYKAKGRKVDLLKFMVYNLEKKYGDSIYSLGDVYWLKLASFIDSVYKRCQ